MADRLKQAARKRERTKTAFDQANEELRDMIIEARADGMGPSEIARHTGLTREWVSNLSVRAKGQ